jgi:uncharacterized protein
MKIDASRALLVFLVASGICFAQDDPVVERPDANGSTQGLTKQARYAPYPEPDSGYVTDLANLLNPDEEEEIERWLWKTEAETGIEIAVVTIQSINDYPRTANGSIESFATGLFDKYGIGNLPENDGVLLLIARRDRKARIELGKAYGRLRDADATRIMEGHIVPRFKQDHYADGITDGVKGIMNEFAGVQVGINWTLIVLMFAVPIVGLIAFSLFKSGKRGWGWVCVGTLVILLLAILRIIDTVARNLPEGSSDSWSSGGFGGGFGGGSSGGGGATGSW